MLDRKIIELYDEYTHAPLDRRIFLGRLARLTGSAAAAAAMLPLLESGGARAAAGGGGRRAPGDGARDLPRRGGGDQGL